MKTIGILLLSWIFASTAAAIDGLVASDLPVGGDVTIPGEYPVVVPAKMDVTFSGVTSPQALTFINWTSTTSTTIRISNAADKSSRTLTLKPGASAIYSFRNLKPIKVRVMSGDIKVSSMQPLKVQR